MIANGGVGVGVWKHEGIGKEEILGKEEEEKRQKAKNHRSYLYFQLLIVLTFSENKQNFLSFASG